MVVQRSQAVWWVDMPLVGEGNLLLESERRRYRTLRATPDRPRSCFPSLSSAASRALDAATSSEGWTPSATRLQSSALLLLVTVQPLGRCLAKVYWIILWAEKGEVQGSGPGVCARQRIFDAPLLQLQLIAAATVCQ